MNASRRRAIRSSLAFATATLFARRKTVSALAADPILPVLWIDVPVLVDDSEDNIPGDDFLNASIKVYERHPGILTAAGTLDLEGFHRITPTVESPSGIKVRGSSSRDAPKKSYALELRDAAGEDVSLPFLGMPRESDWVLYSSYPDETCLRNVLTYWIGRNLMPYAPRTEFVELIINGSYRGVYVVVEKIKRDSKRVDIRRPARTSSGDLTGGYIFKRDHEDPGWTWESKFRNPETLITGKADPTAPPSEHRREISKWTVDYPKPSTGDDPGDELTEDQKIYLEAYMDELERFIRNEGSGDWWLEPPDPAYRERIDLQSWVDFTLIQELTLNGDGYYKSMYLVKKSDSQGGRVHMGPVWDFDGPHAYDCAGPIRDSDWSMRVAHGCPPEGWLYSWSPSWTYRKLWLDPWFKDAAVSRWRELRGSETLSLPEIDQQIDTWVSTIREARGRDEQRWKTLQNAETTYADEIAKLKSFIHRRVTWMDANLLSPVAAVGE